MRSNSAIARVRGKSRRWFRARSLRERLRAAHAIPVAMRSNSAIVRVRGRCNYYSGGLPCFWRSVALFGKHFEGLHDALAGGARGMMTSDESEFGGLERVGPRGMMKPSRAAGLPRGVDLLCGRR
ncbi:MAG: hypothetical protein R3A78_10390 [Polyangiales bacterium]